MQVNLSCTVQNFILSKNNEKIDKYSILKHSSAKNILVGHFLLKTLCKKVKITMFEGAL
jgi:hypothetical protein